MQTSNFSVVQRLRMNVVDLTNQLHDVKVCFLTTLIILCISARLGIAICGAFHRSCKQHTFPRIGVTCFKAFGFPCLSSFVQKPQVHTLEAVIRFFLQLRLWLVSWGILVGICHSFDDFNIHFGCVKSFPTFEKPYLFCLFSVWTFWFVCLSWDVYNHLSKVFSISRVIDDIVSSRLHPTSTIIRFLSYPSLIYFLWCFLFMVYLGSNKTGLLDLFCFDSDLPITLGWFCMLEVWTLWFVGWASLSFSGCDDLHCSDRICRFHTRCIRIKHQRHFFRARIRHFRYSHPKQFSTNFHERDDFLREWNLQQDLSFISKFSSFFRHSTTYFWGQLVQHGFFDCLWIGMKLQSFLFRLPSTLLFCQIHLFAINWMISTSDSNHWWWEPKCPSSGRFSHVHSNCRYSPWKLHIKNGPTPTKVHYHSHDASNRVIKYFRHCAAHWKKRCEFTPGKCSHLFEGSSNNNPFCGVRVGEAKNPGPESHRGLDIGTFNPTQLLNKEDDILQWGQGIYTACETSVTPVAHRIVNGKFRKAGWFSRWSKFVDPQQPKTSQIRGKAGGTAILSTYPLKPYMEPCPDILCNTDRFCEGVAQIHCNTNIYVSAMYGFPIANAYLNALQMNNSLFTPIAERALNFQGPAIITGDFNCDLKDLVAWKTLTNTGWWDAALLDSFLYNRAPQPTCRESTRRSFVLVNSHLASRLIQCRTCDDFLFSSHPLLLANFNLETLIQPQMIWTLPKATDDLLFDSDAQNHQIEKDLNEWGDKISEAITSTSPDHAAQLFARLVQNSWVASNVDVEGNPIPLQPGFLGRDRIKLIQKKHCSIPLIHKGRDGTFEPCCGQSSISIRRRTRQMRRLETLVLQVKSRQKTGNVGAAQKCQELWDSIRNAKGFHKSFSWWIGSNLGWFVPEVCPHIEYLTSIIERTFLSLA